MSLSFTWALEFQNWATQFILRKISKKRYNNFSPHKYSFYSTNWWLFSALESIQLEICVYKIHLAFVIIRNRKRERERERIVYSWAYSLTFALLDWWIGPIKERDRKKWIKFCFQIILKTNTTHTNHSVFSVNL